MTIIVEEARDVGTLEPEWDGLGDDVAAPPFIRPGWFRAWYAAFGSKGAAFVTAREGTQLVGVLALQRRRMGVAAPANWHTPTFAPVVRHEDAAGALYRWLLEQGPAHVSFSFVEADSDFASVVRGETRLAGFRLLERTIERSPYVVVEGAWEDYEAGLARKFRSELRRRRKKLEAEAPVRLEVIDDHPSLLALLDEGLRVEASGWKGTSGTAVASERDTLDFYRSIATWAASRGWLRLAFLRVGDKAVAFDFSLEYKGRHYLLKTGYDPEYKTLGPGQLLRYEMLRRAFDSGQVLYDFLGTDAPWKMEWTSLVRGRQRLQAFSRSQAGTFFYAGFAHGRPLAKKLYDIAGSVRR